MNWRKPIRDCSVGEFVELFCWVFIGMLVVLGVVAAVYFLLG